VALHPWLHHILHSGMSGKSKALLFRSLIATQCSIAHNGSSDSPSCFKASLEASTAESCFHWTRFLNAYFYFTKTHA
jgi:hypothetical protein